MSQIFLAAAILLAAVPAFAYKGDGKLTDHGPKKAHYRFELDLGPVDLGQYGRREYRVAELPDKEFTFGLRITAPSGGRLSRLPAATVRMTLLDDRGGVLFEVSEELPNWIRSETVSEWFLYLRGAQGQGTHLPVHPAASYRLIFETVRADSSMSKFNVRLLGVGGAWK